MWRNNYWKRNLWRSQVNEKWQKTPRNDGLSKEFYEVFWDEASINDAFIKEGLSTFQKQGVIKLIEKKDRDKGFVKNWRPLSLLNLKLISKLLGTRLKDILPGLISRRMWKTEI